MTKYPFTRRELLMTVPGLAAASGAWAQSVKQPIQVRSLSHMTLTVSDQKRSVDFYQGLFGLPIQHRQENSIGLRIGSGPQYISLSQGRPNAKPEIAHFCMTVEKFSVEGVTKMLSEHGVSKGDAGAMKTWVRMRGEGTSELYVSDPDGINVQLQDVTYCGGSGAMGNICKPPEPAQSKGLLAIQDLSHFTLGVSNRQRSTAFYQDLFGLRVQAVQGDAPALGVGSRGQFVFISDRQSKGIAHGCFTMEGFDPDKVMKKLAEYGIKPRGNADGPPGPLVSYISMRMEDRGGAKGGTPELYFTDPDGILMQIQDVKYCGGSGYLGEICR